MAWRGAKSSALSHATQYEVNHLAAGQGIWSAEKMQRRKAPIQTVQTQVLG